MVGSITLYPNAGERFITITKSHFCLNNSAHCIKNDVVYERSKVCWLVTTLSPNLMGDVAKSMNKLTQNMPATSSSLWPSPMFLLNDSVLKLISWPSLSHMTHQIWSLKLPLQDIKTVWWCFIACTISKQVASTMTKNCHMLAF